MRSKNKKIILGYILIILGIGLPLYAFTSMSLRNLGAKGSYENFHQSYENIDSDKYAQIEESARIYNEGINSQSERAIIDPFVTEDYKAQIDVDTLSEDGIFAYLIVPKLNMIKPIYLDASYEHLDLGAAQVDGTNLPVGGLGTRSVIAGHRGWYGDVMFLNIDQLEEGDVFYIDLASRVLEYRIGDKQVIGPEDWQELQAAPDQDMVTLLTCHPFRPPRPYRLLINGYRVNHDQTQEESMDLASTDSSTLVNLLEETPTDSFSRNINISYMVLQYWAGCHFY